MLTNGRVARGGDDGVFKGAAEKISKPVTVASAPHRSGQSPDADTPSFARAVPIRSRDVPCTGKRVRGHVAAAVVWLGLIAGGTLAFQYFGERRPEVAGCEDGAGSAEIRIPAARNGHFYLEGAVNGVPVSFLVDTGATYVAVGQAAADQAGISGGSPAVFETAAGRVEGRIVPGQRVTAACFELPAVTVAVNPGLGETALLGQNVLRKFEVVQTRQELRLRRRSDAP